MAAVTHTAKQTRHAPWSAFPAHCWRLLPRCHGHLLLLYRRVRRRRHSRVPSPSCRAHPDQSRRRVGRVEDDRGGRRDRGRERCAPVLTREVLWPSTASTADREVSAAGCLVGLSQPEAAKGCSQRRCRYGRHAPQKRPPLHTRRVAGHDGALRQAVAGVVRRRLAQHRVSYLSRVGSRDRRMRAGPRRQPNPAAVPQRRDSATVPARVTVGFDGVITKVGC